MPSNSNTVVTLADVVDAVQSQATFDLETMTRKFQSLTTLEAADKHDISFLANKDLLGEALQSRAGLLLVDPQAASVLNRAFEVDSGIQSYKPILLEVRSVWAAVYQALLLFNPPPKAKGAVHPTATVADTATVGRRVDVGPNTVIGAGAEIEDDVILGANVLIGANVKIGSGTRIFPRASVLHDCIVGRRCMLGPGAVIGYDGFKTEVIDGHHVSIPQVGIVVLEEGVEIGANTCIDRASFTETRIGARTKIDNLVQIGHNVQIGRDCLIAAQVGIAGSARIGDGCMLGGQVGIADNVAIAPGTVVLAQSGVSKSLEKNMYFGSPALPAKRAYKINATLNSLPELARAFKKLVASQQADQAPQPAEEAPDVIQLGDGSPNNANAEVEEPSDDKTDD
jgi:UDP-3-O-[3-hydroxymyristoyl] glucosamine N-acyltransferase